MTAGRPEARRASIWVVDQAPGGPAGQPRWPAYVAEILDHLRAAWRSTPADDLAAADEHVAVLVFPAGPTLTDGQVAAVTDWVHRGGSVLLCGGPGSLGELAGVAQARTVDEAYLQIQDSPVWQGVGQGRLHAFGGARLRVEDATVLAVWADAPSEAAAAVRRVGTGHCLVLGADPWQSVVRIQQGWPVVRDGHPAPDGSAPVDDGVLKSDDAISLSYDDDRMLPGVGAPSGQVFRHEYPPTERPPFFHLPQADLWRALVVRSLWWLASEAGHATTWLHYWPAGCEAVAHMSHDTDGNRDDEARVALETFAEAGVTTTWCFLYPGGLSESLVEAVKDAGHEVALHFNALDDDPGCGWGESELRRQLDWLTATAGVPVVTNKNHFLRWQGWAEFFTWCAELGIQIDQSHGPSKQGNVGFPFGSCHLSFPMSDDGRLVDVLALPLQCQDLAWTTPAVNRDVFVDQVLQVHGVFHCLFHGANLAQHPEVREAALETADTVRDRGLPWWTSAALNEWERARRHVRPSVERSGAGWRVTVQSGYRLNGVGVMVVLPGEDGHGWRLVEGDGELRLATRHGLRQVEIATDLAPGTSTFVLEPSRSSTPAPSSGSSSVVNAS